MLAAYALTVAMLGGLAAIVIMRSEFWRRSGTACVRESSPGEET